MRAWIICFCLLAAVGESANRGLRLQEQTSGAAVQTSQDSGADAQAADAATTPAKDPDAVLHEFYAWFVGLLKTAAGRNRAVNALERAVTHQDSGDAVTVHAFKTGIRHAQSYREQARALPTGESSELQDATNQLELAADSLWRAIASMRVGYTDGSDTEWARGQRQARASDRRAKAGLRAARAYWRALGGKDAFGKDYPISKLALDE